jgi:hypothetical protein
MNKVILLFRLTIMVVIVKPIVWIYEKITGKRVEWM